MPGGIVLDADDAGGAGGPPVGGIAAAPFEDDPVGADSGFEEIDGGECEPGDGPAVGADGAAVEEGIWPAGGDQGVEALEGEAGDAFLIGAAFERVGEIVVAAGGGGIVQGIGFSNEPGGGGEISAARRPWSAALIPGTTPLRSLSGIMALSGAICIVCAQREGPWRRRARAK